MTVVIGRFFLGLALGMEGSIHSMYVCELASGKYRGPMSASGVVTVNLGILTIYIVGTLTDWQVNIVTSGIAAIEMV